MIIARASTETAAAAAVFGATESSEVGAIRRSVTQLCRSLSFSESDTGRAALVATELATNLVRYARGGAVWVGSGWIDGAPHVDLWASDQGPGIADLAASLVDGVSGGTGLGGGLGAIQRQSDRCEIHTRPGGTLVWSRIFGDGARPTPRFVAGATLLPAPYEVVAGDAWAVAERDDRLVALVIDGLGHGVGAHEAAIRAVESFWQDPFRRPGEVLHDLDQALRGSRGAAVALALVEPGRETVTFCGIGNVRAVLLGDGSHTEMVSHYGIVGSNVRTLREFTHPWDPSTLLVMHTDGASARWSLSEWPHVQQHHPAVLAAAVTRAHRRERDDTCVLVVADGGG